MRIVVVSAHYPPNFVSGGTLQPQRLAQGLRERGHDVWVYAGWLGDDRPAGSSWSEDDPTGMPVRWLATTPWTGWDDRRNFDNPAATADFDAFLTSVRPDVVHLHSLQSLGAGLLDVAALHGAAVVVTMHDFWWCCARQFLVDRDLQPCSPVVDGGACACSRDHWWLTERNAWLRDRLAVADAVLAPSSSAAELGRANGLAPGRLEVDENGLPDVPVTVRRGSVARRADEPVRFVYAGGAEEMKGIHALVAACQRLADVDGWQLRAHGARPWVERHGISLDGLPVELPDPFAPDQMDIVFSSADVLILPSVMRESHSLLTREALVRGVPVLTSDCVGPEEVVEDGVNGLVVPTGDADALAQAMRRLIQDRDHLTTLRDGTHGVTLRALDEQVVGLERRYAELLEQRTARASTGGQERPIRHVVFIVGIQGAPLRYRVRLPAEGLGLLGITSEVRWFTDPRLQDDIAKADVVVIYRAPATPFLLELIAELHERDVRVLFDSDDLIFDPTLAAEIPALQILPETEAELWLQGVHRYRTTMEASDGFIASTTGLARHAEAVTSLPTRCFENGVGLVLARAADAAIRQPRSAGPLRIGYFSGTDTHDHDWQMIEPAIAAVLDARPQVELWLGGHLPATPVLDRFGTRVRRLPFQPWQQLPKLLRDLDVNLSPLVLGSRFNESKSAIKWLEAALVGTPTVASPTQPFRDAIDHGRTGLIAGGPDEWVEHITALLDDRVLRRSMGQRARRAALVRWSPHLQAQRYLQLLQEAARFSKRQDTMAWLPVTGGEVPLAREIEPYGDEAAGRSAWREVSQRLARARVNLRSRLAESRRRHGTGGAVLRAPAAAARAGARRLTRRHAR